MNRPTTAPAPRAGLVTRVILAVAAVVGAFLVVFPLATSLPGKSSASGALMTAMRPSMSDAVLAQGRTDQATVGAMAKQMNEQMLPALAAQMHASPAQLSAYFGQNLPATARGMGELQQLQASFGNLQATMEQQQSNFRQADQIPTSYLPPTSMTWLYILPGALLIAIAGLGFFRPGWTRRMLAGASIVGMVMAVGLLATSMYGKASAADEMTSAFKPIFASSSVAQLHTLGSDAAAMSTELTTTAVPALATALHVTPSQLAATMATSYPDVVSGMQALPAIVGRMQGAVGLIEAQASNFEQSASIPWSPGSMVGMFWAMMAPALFVALLGAAGVVAATPTGAVAVTRRRFTLRPGAQHH